MARRPPDRDLEQPARRGPGPAVHESKDCGGPDLESYPAPKARRGGTGAGSGPEQSRRQPEEEPCPANRIAPEYQDRASDRVAEETQRSHPSSPYARDGL